jgi:multiple sugar transport system permease protein
VTQANETAIGRPPRPARKATRRGVSGPVGRTRMLAYGLLLPAFLSVVFLLGYPICLVAQLAFRVGDSINISKLGELPIGLDNFEEILSDTHVWMALWHSVVYSVGTIVPAFLIGLGTALLLNRAFPGRRLLRGLLLLPWAVPGVIVSIIFLWLLDSSFGVLNAMLRDVGLLKGDIPWLTRPGVAMVGVIIPTIWKAYPFFTLTLLAALQTIPAALYEAAKVDGANGFRRFIHVTLPGIQGPAVLTTILQTLWVLREFDIIYPMTGGGPDGSTETLALYVYNEAFGSFHLGTASVIGVIMLAIALVLVVLSLRPLSKEFF